MKLDKSSARALDFGASNARGVECIRQASKFSASALVCPILGANVNVNLLTRFIHNKNTKMFCNRTRLLNVTNKDNNQSASGAGAHAT